MQSQALVRLWVLLVTPLAVSQGDGDYTDPGAVSVSTTQQATSRAGYTTFRVAVSFNARVVADVYALFGEAGSPLVIPPGWQAAAPFGSNVGPTNPAFFPMMPECEFDSFLTIGSDGPGEATVQAKSATARDLLRISFEMAEFSVLFPIEVRPWVCFRRNACGYTARTPGAMSSIGIDFASWSETTGLSTGNGAMFFMDPDHGARLQDGLQDPEPVVFLQLTVRSGSTFSGQLSAQGRSMPRYRPGTSSEDWEKKGMRFTQAGGPLPPPPTPPAPPVRPPDLRPPGRPAGFNHTADHPIYAASRCTTRLWQPEEVPQLHEIDVTMDPADFRFMIVST